MEENRPLYKQAYEDYKKGLKQEEIAKKYNVSINTVKSWQQRKWKKWDQESVHTKKEKCAHQDGKKVCTPKQKRGAPKGNQNAKGNTGGGAPKGNKNSLKHGIYVMMPFHSLSEEQQGYILDGELDPDVKLIQEIKALDIRMGELWEMLNKEKSKNAGVSIKSISKKVKTSDDGETEEKETITSTVAVLDNILKIQAEITRIQKEKGKLLAQIERNQNERTKINISTSKLNMEQQRLVLEAEKQNIHEDNTETNVTNVSIYIPDNKRNG